MSSENLIVKHLVEDVLPRVREYVEAENRLTEAFIRHRSEEHCAAEIADARRKASDLAVAIDGLADRCERDHMMSRPEALVAVRPLCSYWDGGGTCPALDVIRAVAVGYKHFSIRDQSLGISTYEQVQARSTGFGQGGFGLGKFGGVPETTVTYNEGDRLEKFLSVVPAALRGWTRFLHSQGVEIPFESMEVFGIEIVDRRPLQGAPEIR